MGVESAALVMPVQVLSDLHIEFAGNRIPPLAPDAELVILAGDLTPVCTHQVSDIAARWAGADRILYVPGSRRWDRVGGSRPSVGIRCWPSPGSADSPGAQGGKLRGRPVAHSRTGGRPP